ncbi:MAG: isoprenylcysteine carboxylmethyltransferase family protein [Clostridia bacterium]|nr:isoprenylcysteine carboxylmethyltransferase family protein [Clostridia bacterium]
MKLLFRALLKFLVGLALVSLLLFLPAGTVRYPGAWLFLALLFIPILVLGAILLARAPALLEKRLSAKEKEGMQRGVVAISALLFLGGFVVAGLDFRYQWSNVPHAVVIVAAVVLLLSYGMYAEVMRENAYLSRTVEVQEGQKVIDSGLYGIVRHPMYAATVFLFLSIPVVLGSWWSLLCFAPYPIVIIARIQNEEKVLSHQLPGYTDYKKRVKYRLIPWIW